MSTELSVPPETPATPGLESGELKTIGTVMSTALLDWRRMSPGRLRLVCDQRHIETVRRLVTAESVASTFFTFTLGEPRYGRFSVDIEVPYPCIDVIDSLTGAAAHRLPR